MRMMLLAFAACASALALMMRPGPVNASAQPVCHGPRITRSGTLRMTYSTENGGYTRFVSSGGGTYGVDPNSLPEDYMDRRLKPNGPAVAVTLSGRTCDDGIFYIEQILTPSKTPLQPYTP